MSISIFIEDIKQFLINEYSAESWEDFINSQTICQCQEIMQLIYNAFHNKYPQLKKYFCEIKSKTKKPIQYHIIFIDNILRDFAKGTLREYIDFDDDELYSPIIFEDRYSTYGLKLITHKKKYAESMFNYYIKMGSKLL